MKCNYKRTLPSIHGTTHMYHFLEFLLVFVELIIKVTKSWRKRWIDLWHAWKGDKFIQVFGEEI